MPRNSADAVKVITVNEAGDANVMGTIKDEMVKTVSNMRSEHLQKLITQIISMGKTIIR